MANKKQTQKTAAEKKIAYLDRGKALFQKRDSLTPGSPESLKVARAILEWTFDVKN